MINLTGDLYTMAFVFFFLCFLPGYQLRNAPVDSGNRPTKSHETARSNSCPAPPSPFKGRTPEIQHFGHFKEGAGLPTPELQKLYE